MSGAGVEEVSESHPDQVATVDRFSEAGRTIGACWKTLVRWLTAHRQLLEFLVTLLLAIGYGSLASIPDSPTTPGGMLGLELPGTRSGALAMRALLGSAGAREVTIALLWDFGFIVFYVVALRTAVRWAIPRRFDNTAGESQASPRRMVERFALRAPWLAGAFDVLENMSLLALINWIQLGGTGVLASVTTIAALSKWTILVFLALYLARSLGVLWWRWVLKERQQTHAKETSQHPSKS